MNTAKTVLLMVSLTVLLIFVGNVIGGPRAMVPFFIMAMVMNLGMYWFSDKMVLAMYRAREVNPAQNPRFYNIVQELSQRAGLPMPKVYIIPTDSPNAFATGRNPKHAAVAATEGLLRMLSERELRGVMAHELAHVKNRDLLTGTIAAGVAGAIMMISRMALWFGSSRDSNNNPLGAVGLILTLILAPIAALLVQLWISRTREFSADETGAEIAGDPLGLASALSKLQRGVEFRPLAAGNEATAHLFIVNPFSGRAVASWFSTHPAVEERIARLEAMAQERT